MKKLIIATLIMVAAGTSAFAADVKVNNKVKVNFEALFSDAENVNWSGKENYILATFTLSEERVEAYFGTDGELIGTIRNVDLKRLPISAIQKIKKDYAAYTITGSIEFEGADEKSYYVSLEKGNKKETLEVSFYGTVSTFRGRK
ncbi:MAG: hypothetical protein V4557_18555 [Bacteroidota bacterium]